MGSLNSKVTPTAGGKSDQENGQYLDPRSPTLHINRSPISTEQAGVSRSSVTKVKDLTAALTETSDHTLRTPYSHLLPKRFQSIVDPRSPSTFDRTPIVFYPDTSVDCSLTNVVSSLQYEELTNEPDADVQDVSFKDCDPEIPEMCNLQIENDESEPILETPGDEKEVTIFEDAEVTPFAGNDPRSPCIAIARTPMVLVKQDEEEEEPVKEQHNQAQVANLEALQADLKAEVKKQEHTPKQGIQDCHGRGEQTPKKDKQTPTSGIKAGNRTPLGCVTNIGTGPQNIRKMALIGQIKQGTVITDEQKLISRVGGNTGSAGLNTSGKQTNRSRIPKLRMS